MNDNIKHFYLRAIYSHKLEIIKWTSGFGVNDLKFNYFLIRYKNKRTDNDNKR